MEACKLTERPFAEFAKLFPDHYLCEAKWDGERVLVTVTDKDVVVQNNYGTCRILSFFPDYEKSIRESLHMLNLPVVLDAEMVSSTANNLYQFLADRTSLENTHLIVFDVLMQDGVDIRSEPLVKRKNLVSKLKETRRVRPIHFELATKADDVWKFYQRTTGPARFEGIVVKPAFSIYTDGAWCKIKKTVTHDVVILAIKKTGAFLRDGGHPVDARCFLIGFVDEEGRVVPYGNVSSGYVKVNTDLLKLNGSEDSEYVYVVPDVVIEIMAHSLVSRKFREPRILRTRLDKKATDCKIPDGS